MKYQINFTMRYQEYFTDFSGHFSLDFNLREYDRLSYLSDLPEDSLIIKNVILNPWDAHYIELEDLIIHDRSSYWYFLGEIPGDGWINICSNHEREDLYPCGEPPTSEESRESNESSN